VVPTLTCKHAAVKVSNLCESHRFCHVCFVHPPSSLDPGKVRQTVARHPVADKTTLLFCSPYHHFISLPSFWCNVQLELVYVACTELSRRKTRGTPMCKQRKKRQIFSLHRSI
jgi:hypothetical protein